MTQLKIDSLRPFLALGAIALLTTLIIHFRSDLKTLWAPAPQAAPTIADPSCLNTYLRFYQEPTIDIRVIFGYKDARPARFVADRYERMGLVQLLLKPCTSEKPRTAVCGFERSQGDADLFKKSLYGPDKKLKTVLLRVTQSSTGPDDLENRKDPYQVWLSRYSKEAFLTGLKSADALFYNGHSRAGGGPDFGPPRLRPDRHADYYWYKEKQLGLKDMMHSLGEGPPHLKLLGLFSCASSKLFSNKITQLKQDLGLITSEKLLYFSDAQEKVIETLSALLEMKCQPEFKQVIETHSVQAGTKLLGFF